MFRGFTYLTNSIFKDILFLSGCGHEGAPSVVSKVVDALDWIQEITKGCNQKTCVETGPNGWTGPYCASKSIYSERPVMWQLLADLRLKTPTPPLPFPCSLPPPYMFDCMDPDCKVSAEI